jgi:hypothetical protein
MVRGYCSRCRRKVGGIRNSEAWQCHKCLSLFCERCCPRKVGWLFKKPVCPDCGIELTEGGARSYGASSRNDMPLW